MSFDEENSDDIFFSYRVNIHGSFTATLILCVMCFRMTLLLGPPSSGKTTLMLALAGKLDPTLKVNFTRIDQ